MSQRTAGCSRFQANRFFGEVVLGATLRCPAVLKILFGDLPFFALRPGLVCDRPRGTR